MALPDWFKNLRGVRIFGKKPDGTVGELEIVPTSDNKNAGLAVVAELGYTEAAGEAVEIELYNETGLVTTNGAPVNNLERFTKWVFHVKGIDSSGATLALGVGLFGDGNTAEFDFVDLRDVSDAAGSPTISSDGVFFINVTNTSPQLPFKEMFVNRLAAGTIGNPTIVVKAIGHV